LTTIVSDLQIVRIAGLSSDHLDLVRCLDGRLLQELESSRSSLAAMRQEAADTLYSLVPALERSDRRMALALRRKLHSDDLDPIARRLSSLLSAALVDRLAEAERHYEGLRSKVESAVHSDEGRVPFLIRRALETPEMLNALELLAPGFLGLRLTSTFAVGARHTKTALAYMGRAALKPSPLSTLTSVGTPGETDARSRIAPSPLFLFRLLHSLVEDPSLVTLLEFKPAYAYDSHVVVRRVVEAHGSAWLEEDIVSLEPYWNEYERLRGWQGGDFGSLAAVTGGDPFARIARWVKLGLVQVVLPGEPGDHLHLALARRFGQVNGNQRAAELAQALESLGAALGSAESSRDDRGPALASARALLEHTARDFRVRKQTARLVDEDSMHSASAASSDLDGVLRRWGDRVRPAIFRSHRYDAIVRRFEQEVGPGATHPDAGAFFIAAHASRQFRDSMRAAWSADRAWIERRSADRSFLATGVTNAPPTVGVMYQELEDPCGGDPSFVVNQLVNGVGGIVARFGSISGGAGSRIRADLLAWIEGMFPRVATRFAFHPSSEVNPLQGAARGILPSIEWTTDPRRAGREFTFEHVGLKHDPERGVLDFVDRDGSPVAIVHLGIVPAWSVAGARGLALCVMDPWVDGTDLTLDSNPLERARMAHAEPRHRPRAYVDDVVVRRETWMVESSEVPFPGETESTAEFVIRFDRWRKDRGIPEEVFGLAISSKGFASEARKPLWVNMLSTHSLYATLPLLRQGTHVRFQEVLPGRWPGGDRVTEHVRFLRWERTHDV
jgi:hypothetical protein